MDTKIYIGRELSGLACVEIQAIMQFLTHVELIRFSRCSRTLLADGDTDIAWHTQPIFPLLLTPTTGVRSPNFLSDDPTLLRRSSIFWRHQPRFGLTFENDTTTTMRICCQFILSRLDAIPRIRSLSFPHAPFTQEEWTTILQHPSLDELIEFHVGSTICSLPLPELERMRSLKALSFPCHYTLSCENLRFLSTRLPQLQTLAFTESRTVGQSESEENVKVTISSLLLEFMHLTNLRIRNFTMSSNEFLATFSSPQLQSLKALHIHDWRPDGLRAPVADHLTTKTLDDLSETFNAMKQLSHLSLISTVGIKDILPLLHFLTQLKRLSLGYNARDGPSRAPFRETLQTLLTHSPHLLCDLVIHPLIRPKVCLFESLTEPVFGGRFHCSYVDLCDICEDEVALWDCPDCRMICCYWCDGELHKPAKLARHQRAKVTQ